MKRKIVNKPYKSRWIGGLYIFLTILITLIYLIIYLFADGAYGTSYFLQVVLNSVMVFVFSLMLIIVISFYTTKYKISDGLLTSWSPFVKIKLKLKDVKKIEKTIFLFTLGLVQVFIVDFFMFPMLVG